MVDVLVLDLGGTLVDGDQPFPHVKAALGALQRFRGSSGRPLQLALVSDFHPAGPPTPAGIKARFTEYLRLLDGFGLRRFVQPVGRHVTLSTHAGVAKPDRRVYELALQRLGAGATLGDCLSITEDAGHVVACQALGMRALRFGGDFADWSDLDPRVVGLLRRRTRERGPLGQAQCVHRPRGRARSRTPTVSVMIPAGAKLRQPSATLGQGNAEP